MVNKISILGTESKKYQTEQQANGGIHDHPNQGQLEFYPAGYTKPSHRDKVSRQALHEALFECAKKIKQENAIFPFGITNHYVQLVPDPTNPFDPAATHLILRVKSGSDVNKQLNKMDLGFVPKKISALLKENINMINNIRILTVQENFHKKYYTTKIAVAYGDNSFGIDAEERLKRFTDLLDE